MVQTQNENAKSALNLLRVDGPVSYSCWVYRNKKDEPTLIHNFGDIHVHRSGCSTMNNNEDPFMSIEELIAGTMHHAYKNNRGPLDKSIIDFFLEDARHECYRTIQKQSRSEMLNQGALNRLEREFAPCLCLTTRFRFRCRLDFPAGRIHASDLRLVLGFSHIEGSVVENWPEIEDKRSDTWKRFKYTIFNQFLHVEDKKIINKLFEMYDEIQALSPEELKKKYYTPLMDIYLLGRLFRKYEPYSFQKKKYAFNNAPVQNAVIYSGDNHKNIYDKFFREIGATLLYSFNSTYISPEVGPAQCVKIPIFINRARDSPYLPMVSDFDKNSIIYGNFNNLNFVSIETEYKKFDNLNKNRKDRVRNYAIEREEKKEVILFRPSQTLFYGQNRPQPKYKELRSEEPQAKRQRIGGKEEEP